MPAMPIVNILCSAAHTTALTPVCRQGRLTEHNSNLMVDLKLHAHATSEQQAKSSKLESFTAMSMDYTPMLHITEHAVECRQHLPG